MASLTGSTIASSYEQLLSLPDGGLNGNTLVAITDGDSSTAIGMKVATNKIEIIPGSDDANAFEVSQADGTAVLTVNTSTVGATLIGTLTVGVNDTGHDVKFFGATATNGYMLWDESTDDLILGSASKMGIGETSPAVGLDVHWDNEISAGFGKATTDTNYISIRTLEEAGKIAGVAFMVGDTTQTGVSSTFQLAGVAGKVINANDSAALQGELGFYTNSGNSIAQKMVLDKDGKLGIGETSPTDPLHVKTTAVETRISLESSTGKWAIGAEDNDKFGILNYGTSTPFIIDSSGQVGIGTASPAAKLFIDQDSNTTAFKIDGENTTTNVFTIEADALTTGAGAYVYSDSDSTGTRNLLEVQNDHASASGTIALKIKQDAQNWAAKFVNGNTTNSYGTLIQAGNDTADAALQVVDKDSSNTLMLVDGSGAVRMSKQPAFMVHPSSGQANIATGTTTVVFGSERFDQGGNYAPNTFTAPVTGKYQFNLIMRTDNTDSAANYVASALVTSNNTYSNLGIWDPGPGSGDWNYNRLSWSLLVDMDAGDTAHVTILISAGASQLDIDTDSFWSGFLAC